MDLRTLFFTTLMCLPAVYAKADATALEGHYYLHGVMEMGAELLLRKDGTFAGAMEYGSANGIAKGTWYVDDDVLMLESDADPQPAKKLEFKFFREFTLKKLEDDAQHPTYRRADVWQKNYVLQMQHARYRQPPKTKPGYVYFEFDRGSVDSLLFDSSELIDLWLPYDSQRTLKKIGFGSRSGPNQWFDVSPSSRQFAIEWKKPGKQLISFAKPEESSLDEAQRVLESDAQNRIRTHYMISLYHYDPIPPPAIEPVDVFWRFEDGSTLQSIWTDSNQQQLTQPYTADNALQKIGMRMKGSTEDVQWFAVSPDARWLRLSWEAYPESANGELSVLFQDLQLAIEPDCLAVDLGGGKGCFRRE